MAYFPNGTSGAIYEERYCFNCIHGDDGCPVMDAHNLFNYEQCDDNDRGKAVKTILGLLIPKTKDGLGAEQCSMFRAKVDAEAEEAEQRRLAAQEAKYQACLEEMRA